MTFREECPSQVATLTMDSPASNCTLAKVWRKTWNTSGRERSAARMELKELAQRNVHSATPAVRRAG
ncbi:hypothetical protein [Streptomyces sp. NPDC008312]|uniref:hypothetical protein n=1 Tax=Streptomyces TaxID=1883 RepID=UPI0036E72D75